MSRWPCSRPTNLHLRFGDRVVLEDVSLAFEARLPVGHHGPKRRRQDHLLQRADRPLQARSRPRAARRARHHRALAAGDRAPRRRPLVPDHEPVRRVHRVRERGDRAARLRARAARDPFGQAYADPALVAEAHDGARQGRPRAIAPTTLAKALPYGARRALEIAVALAAGRSCCSSTSRPPASAATAARGSPSWCAKLKGAAHHRHHRARHAVPVLARRRDFGHPLGPGDRARNAERRSRPTPGSRPPTSGGCS